MSGLTRFDQVVVGLVLALLVALAGLAVANRSGLTAPAAGGPAGPSVAASPGAPVTTTVPSSPNGAGRSIVTDPSTTAPVADGAVPAPVPGPVSAVGDSILLDIQPYLQADISSVRVDGLVSRQFDAGVQVVEAERAAGTLGNVVVVELGSNGEVTPAEFDAMLAAASGASRVVFVNVNVPRPWASADNAVLAAGVAAHPGLAVLADWYTLSTGHPEWFTADQVHLDPAGAQALANLVARDA